MKENSLNEIAQCGTNVQTIVLDEMVAITIKVIRFKLNEIFAKLKDGRLTVYGKHTLKDGELTVCGAGKRPEKKTGDLFINHEYFVGYSIDSNKIYAKFEYELLTIILVKKVGGNRDNKYIQIPIKSSIPPLGTILA